MPCVCEKYEAPLRSYEDVLSRCNAADEIGMFLASVQLDPAQWLGLYKCRHCGTLWAEERPFSEQHGGGPPCYYAMSSQDAEAWLETGERVAALLRARNDDKELLDVIGPEQGPEQCRAKKCTRLTANRSVYCPVHHFQMVKNREPYHGLLQKS